MDKHVRDFSITRTPKGYLSGAMNAPENQRPGTGVPEKYSAGIYGFPQVTGRGITRFAMSCFLLILFYTATSYSQPSNAFGGDDPTNPPLLFLGNKTLPPMIYMKDGKPVGIIVDLAEALKSRMSRPVSLQYMDWSKAQQLVLEGKAAALLQINPSEERKKIYDFSNPLLESEFSIFILSDRGGVYDIASLRGLKVGVEEKGLPIQILKPNPLIKIVVIPDISSGFHLLANGSLDAVVVDRWVGSFVLAENGIRKIRIAGEPINKSDSAIAVKKGNTKLLADINKALAEIKEDGTYSEILAKWEPKEIVFQTKDQYFRQKVILTAILCLLFIVSIFGIFLLIAIKKRSQSEESLRQSENKLRATLDAAPFPMAVVDSQDNNIHFWSRSALALFGHTAPTTSAWYQIAYPDPDYRREVIERWKPFLEKARESGQPVNTGEYRVSCRDGSIRMCEIYATFLPNNLIVTFNDITERKQVEAEKAELEAQNRQLQKAESLAIMAGAIAHHFNNQLQAVMGNLEMAMDYLPRGADISQTLAEAMKAACKSAEISALMLTYLGQTSGRRELTDLSEVCRQSLALIQAAVPKGLILEADFPSSGPVIRANAGQIQQVLTNLVTNALEAENRKGIGMTVKTVSQTDIPALKRFPIDWQPQEGIYACLEVTDTGYGIACRDIEKIFDPFYSTKFTGRGMGLSVVLGIVKAHNGGITVESEPGRGSIFRVFFPLPAEEVHRQPDKPARSPEMQGGATVLLIEDEEQVRKMAGTMLTHLGYHVLEASDGTDGVEIFRQHQDEIRCVLSDFTMPRMSGWETLAALRKLSPDIPVILSSGYDEAHVMADEHPERPDAFLGKPYRLQELRDTIRRTLADKK